MQVLQFSITCSGNVICMVPIRGNDPYYERQMAEKDFVMKNDQKKMVVPELDYC